MPEPTDHRPEAEHALGEAAKIVDTDLTDHNEDMIGHALIGIGHWLGAIHDALLTEPSEPAEDILERRMEALAQLFTAGGSMPTAAAIRAALRGEPASPPPERLKICTHREHVHGVEKGCALWANHPGEHRLTVFSPAPHPPLSPSETIDVPNYLVSHEDGKQALYDHLRSQGLHPPVSPSEG